MESAFPQAASTFLVNLSLAWIAGALAARLWLSDAAEPWQHHANRRLGAGLTVGLIAACAGIFLSLWTESSAMGDVPWLEAWPACKEMLTSTHYGHAGVAAMLLLTVALAVHWMLSGSERHVRHTVAMGAIMLSVALARVTIGHAYGDGPFHAAMWLEWLHLILMSVWTGVVFISGWLVLPMLGTRTGHSQGALASYLHAMSNWAVAAVAGILATGIYNSWRVLDSPGDLLEVDYGKLLLIKIVLVVFAVILGGYNKFHGLSAVLGEDSVAKAERGLRTVITVLRIESAALVLVLVCASLLTTSAPPAHA